MQLGGSLMETLTLAGWPATIGELLQLLITRAAAAAEIRRATPSLVVTTRTSLWM